MSKVAVVYWSGTGNTEAMAKAVAAGAEAAGAEVTVCGPDAFGPEQIAQYDGIAFGCPAMGAEDLENVEFLPVLEGIEPSLVGKKVALFGSYDWGAGEWLSNWEARCAEKGISLAAESVKCNNTPDDGGLAACRALGAAIA